ncbi:uncharacterized protein LOC125678769 isoform X7 [Ostrea edulis]|uniref:uncharacterized protein LOC125678769 isoform X7 n=1 Tax=Ostrea edulis TaxID=37623 RepID=UPI0024AF3C90|nr:uncharacterized protein LOC125678769 isoform X7 [Ostrea edulis]
MSYYIPISAIIIGYMVHIDCQSINICANPENGQSCTLTCNTTDFSQTVQFLLGGAVQGSCTVFGSVSSCGSGLSQSGTITTYTIAALSRGTHEGDWSCKFGTATSSPVPLVVNTVPSVVNIIQTIPEVNSTEPTDKVKVSAECYCIYPFTSVIDVFNSEGVSGTSKQIATVDSGSIISNVNIGPPCLSDEYKIEISNFTVEPDISGSNVYIEIQFGSYKTAKYGPLNIAGPTTTPIMESSTTVMSSTTTERSGLSEELRNIVIIVSSVGGTVLIVVVIILIVCCKRRANGKKSGGKHLKKQEFKSDVNYNLHNATNTQSKQAPVQYNYKKNEKANNEMYNLNPHGYVYPNHPGYDYIYTNDRGYGGRKVPYHDGRHNLHYDPYRRNNYPREMPHSVPYSGYRSPVQYNSRYGSPVQYNNMLGHEGRQYRRQQTHRGHADRVDPSDQSGYTRRQYDNNWDTLF